MPTIKFANGKSVRFASYPTPEEVDEVERSFATSNAAAQPKEQGILSKAYDIADTPEKLLKKGFDYAGKKIGENTPDVVTGNPYVDMTVNAPKILAQSAVETAGKIVPGMVSPEALVSGGVLRALKPFAPEIKAVGRFAGNQAENLSGLSYHNKGILSEAAADPSLILSRGTDSARKIYRETSDGASAIRQELLPLKEGDFVDKARQILEGGGALSPEEALEARKATDSLRNRFTDAGYNYLRGMFDDIAKSKFSGADEAFARGSKAEALRNIFPQNKTGGPSIFKIAAGTMLGHGGGFLGGGPGAAAVRALLAASMSPAAQGIVASGVGATARMASANPVTTGAAAGAALKRIFGRNE